MLFAGLRRRFNDARTLALLCKGAEREARAAGQTEPGAEHFLLAALELPDGSARRAFERLGVAPAQVRAAIERQYAQALGDAVGIEPATPLSGAGAGVYRAAASGQEIVQALARRSDGDAGLRGADVLRAIAAMRHGVAARSLRALDLDEPAICGAVAAV